jgi:hypothetical protein
LPKLIHEETYFAAGFVEPPGAKALIRFTQYNLGNPQAWICRREDIACHWMARFPAPA